MDALLKLAEDIGEIKGMSKATLEQARKTNGHVAELFRRMNEVEKIQAGCPVNDLKISLDQVTKETEVSRFYQKYPKLLRATLFGMVLLFLIQIGFSVTMVRQSTKTDVKIEQTDENSNLGQRTRE